MSKLSKSEAAEVVASVLGTDASTLSGNWVEFDSKSSKQAIYFSQCKPSAASKGHWKYDFFHTLSFSTVQEIGERSGFLILINYVDRTYALLNTGDLLWVARNSSRTKSNEGVVCDFVIERNNNGAYDLRPYDRQRQERHAVEVMRWKMT